MRLHEERGRGGVDPIANVVNMSCRSSIRAERQMNYLKLIWLVASGKLKLQTRGRADQNQAMSTGRRSPLAVPVQRVPVHRLTR